MMYNFIPSRSKNLTHLGTRIMLIIALFSWIKSMCENHDSCTFQTKHKYNMKAVIKILRTE